MEGERRMRIIRRAFVVLTMLLPLEMAGCGSFIGRTDSGKGQAVNRDAYLSGTQDEQADEMMGKIVDAMDSRDADAMKALFSEYAVSTAASLDSQIEGLFEFYKGPSVSYDGKSDYADGATTWDRDDNGSIGTGHAYWLLSGRYTLKTADEKYQVKIIFYTLNEEEPGKVGLSYLEIVTQDYYDQDWFVMQSPDAAPGIYIQS